MSNDPPLINPVVVIADAPVSIVPKPEVIDPALIAPVVTIPVPPAIGLNTEAIAVPPIVIASASNVPSISALPLTSSDPASNSPDKVIFLNPV